MDENNNNPDQQHLTGELLLKIALVIFVVEILIMALLPLIPLPDSRFIDALADASLLSILTVILLIAWIKTDRLFFLSFKSKHVLIFALYALPAVGILALITTLSYQFQAEEKVEQAFGQHENAMHEAAHEMASYFNTRTDELLFLKNHIQTYLQSKAAAQEPHWDTHISKLFADYIAQHENLVQLRLIDIDGLELIRFDKKMDGTTYPASQLQNKSNRDYFIEGLRLKPGQIYFSQINLNREFGKVEMPVKPVLRGVIPVILEGKTQYLMVLNWKLSRLFDHLRHYSTNFITQQIADEQGHWVLAVNPEHEWGSDIAERSQYGMSVKYQALWEKVQNQSSEVLRSDHSRIKSGVVNVPQIISVVNSRRAYVSVYSYYIISELTDEAAQKLTNSLKQSHFYLFLLALPFILLTTWLLLVMKQSQLQARHQIFDHAQQLEKMVAERTQELQLALDNEHRANKAKSEFLANMSHELRTPMHSILSFSQIALKKTQDEKLQSYLEKVHISGERLTRLLNNLLDLAKLEAGKMDLEILTQDMNDVIKSVIEEMHPLFLEKGTEVNFSAAAEGLAEFDRDRITQVIYNLLYNAVKFSPEKSVIEISLQNRKILSEDYLEISVTDEGPGIPSEEAKQIFDKFEQSSKTKSKAGGTGLGLAISQEIVHAHHGSIWVESPPPDKTHGSQFIVQLPCEQNT